MPVSQETAARADHPLNTPVYDRDAYVSDSDANDMQHGEPSSGASKSLNPDFGSDGGQPSMPSEEVQPGVADDVAQQGATQPGSGSAVTTSATGASGGSGSHQPTFKERVIGVAKKTRGATLGNTETKEQGERILQGQEVYETKKVGPGAKKERSGSI
ncbi:hypothetical protein EUX98_g7365 [Antrodiella citrinella]|uniref:Uncharacterized protein n=1 Tax=Antrodiella citrinella TaxID=2447956 RepID=A0A4S4MP41_9APHY|nr:hypothetical protein EUX98_g7365 [Antrodiella citrinella]